MARFCEYCGTKNEDGSAFCSNCGKELKKPEQQKVQQPAPAQPVLQQQAYKAPVAQPYTPPVSQTPYYAAPGQPARKKSNTGLIIGIAAAVLVAAAVIVLLVIRPFGGGSNSGAAMDPSAVFAQVGESYMDLLPEKPSPIVPGEPLPTAAPYEPEPDPEPLSGSYTCNYLAFTMEPGAGWYADESLLYSDYMVTFSKDDYSILSVLYSPENTTDDFEWDYQSFVDEYAVSSGGSDGEITSQGWTTTLQGYDTYYMFFTTYSGSAEHLYNYTFVINAGANDCFVITYAQASDSATEQDIDEAFAMIDSFIIQ